MKIDCKVVCPPRPLQQFRYHCSDKFLVDPVLDLFKDHEVFGIVVVHGEDAKFYHVKLNKQTGFCETTLVKHHTDSLPNRQKKGGQSQARIMRLRQNAISRFVDEVSEHARKVFMDQDYQPSVCRLLICGMGPKRFEVAKVLRQNHPPLAAVMLDEMPACDDILAAKSKLVDLLATVLVLSDTDRALQEFNDDVKSHDGHRVVYGPDETKAALSDGLLKCLFLPLDCPDKQRWQKVADEVGCTVWTVGGSNCGSLVESQFVSNFGGWGGLRWYAKTCDSNWYDL